MPDLSQPALTDGLPPGPRIKALVAVLVSIAMATLDTAIVNTALPTIANDIGATSAASIWVVNAYQLVVVAGLLPLAALGEIVGHRRVYIVGIVLFTLTSLACGLAWSLPTLVAARAAQGLGAAAIMSVNGALIRFIVPARMLGRGVGLNALVVALAFTFGPTAASAVLSVSSWHWLFLINVPAGLIAIWLSSRTLPMTELSRRPFDPIAAILCACFLALLIFGLGEVAHGASWTWVAAEWAASALCCIVLMRREAGNPAPIFVVDLFLRPAFTLSALTSVFTFMVQGLAFVSLPFLLQTDLGYSQVATGFLMTPWPAVVAIMAPIAGRLSDRYPAGLLGGIGLVMLCLGMASLALLPPHPSDLAIGWRMVLCGAGFGFFQSPNMRALMMSAPPERSGGASGIVATARLLGQSSGSALVALCLTIAGPGGTELALWLGSAFAAIGGIVSVMRLVGPRAVQEA
jgi:DHA2 family multidrug resistance protein-like MFS transporter